MLPPSTRTGRSTNPLTKKQTATRTTIRTSVRFGLRPISTRCSQPGGRAASAFVPIFESQFLYYSYLAPDATAFRSRVEGARPDTAATTQERSLQAAGA